MKPICIASLDYNITSGGVKVMYSLYGWLLTRGLEVYMNKYPHPDVIAIYPEIYHGNPVGASRVVRYILNTPGVMGMTTNGKFRQGPTSFDKTDKLIYFSQMFSSEKLSDKDIMFLPAIDLSTFKDQGKKRTKTCFLVGKGENKNKHPKDAIELNRRIAFNQQEIANILNECHTFYCYDPLTAMMECARLCGCKVEYHGGKSMEELEKYEPGINGINSELDTPAFREKYIGLRETFERKLDAFIEELKQ